MKHVFYSIVSLLMLVAVAVRGQDRNADLIERLEAVDSAAYRMAVEDMGKLSKGTFKAPTDWQKALNELLEKREQLVQGLRNGEKGAASKAENLLSQLDQTLLANPLLQGKQVLYIRRHFADNDRRRMGGNIGLAPSNFQNDSEIWNPKEGWDNEYVSITGFGGKLREEVVYKPAQGLLISDTEPHFSGEKVMFSAIGSSDRWHLFELDLKTKEVKQLTPDTYKDFDSFDGCYTPDGRYIFCATATFLGLPCTNGGNKMCGMFIYDPKTGETRQLTFDQDSNWNPVVMNNGQIMYQRWEYADIPHSNSRYIFSMNPDGTSQMAYYGSGSYFPTATFGARPIPGHPTAFVGVAGGHHSVSRSGRLLIFDPVVGRKEADGVVAEIPYRGRKVEPRVRDRLPDGVWPHFLHPFPLNENYFLVSMKRSQYALWGIYLVDRFNNMTLITEGDGMAMVEPVLLDKVVTPPVIPDRIKPGSKTATVFVQDVYFGDGLKNIPRGTVKKLRIGTYNFSPLNQGGLLGTIGLDGPWDIKRINGEVNVEEDGSVMFTVPANTPIFIQPLDAEGKALQIMRSWFTAMPGETVSCLGCHEDRSSIPVPKASIASKKAPQTIQPFFDRPRGFSFRHEVQPVLDAKCVGCHDGSDPDRPYFKGDKRITDWRSAIAGAASPAYGGDFTESYYQLQRYVRRPGIESDIAMLEPMDVHADQTELMQILNKGHHGVKLSEDELRRLACWIDFNAPFHGRRSDIKNFPDTRRSYDLRAKYMPMLGLDLEDIEWLPELKTDTPFTAPEQPAEIVGDTAVLEGWPHYRAGKQYYEANNQVGLGDYRMSIDLGEGVKLHFIKVPAGRFIMGSDRNRDEMPRSVQQIDKPFWIGQFEITNRQYALFDPEHDSRTEHRHGYQFGRKGYPLNEADQPVVRIPWNKAMEYCQWLSEKTGFEITLPTEAEWEWACRAGSDTPYSFGDLGCNFASYANFGDVRLREFASCSSYKFYESCRVIDRANRYDDWIPRDTTYDDGCLVSDYVGKYRANPWDIYDMHGNVWEWTLSAYRPYPYRADDGRNDPVLAEKRVVRGGSWYDRPEKGTSSYRLPYQPYQGVYNVGFRVVLHETE